MLLRLLARLLQAVARTLRRWATVLGADADGAATSADVWAADAATDDQVVVPRRNGPPAHWVERVRHAAPQLLQPAPRRQKPAPHPSVTPRPPVRTPSPPEAPPPAPRVARLRRPGFPGSTPARQAPAREVAVEPRPLLRRSTSSPEPARATTPTRTSLPAWSTPPPLGPVAGEPAGGRDDDAASRARSMAAVAEPSVATKAPAARFAPSAPAPSERRSMAAAATVVPEPRARGPHSRDDARSVPPVPARWAELPKVPLRAPRDTWDEIRRRSERLARLAREQNGRG